MSDADHRVCPVEKSGSLDNTIRRWFQNPLKILRPYITERMTVLDVGCGPGFFSIDMALLAGTSGRVIACDVQEGMLQKVREKIQGTEIETRITLHKCDTDRIGVLQHVDFVLLFYVVHEIPNKGGLFTELHSILTPGGQVLIVEPPFHVSQSVFDETITHARAAGFINTDGPKMLFQKTAILKKAGSRVGSPMDSQ